MCGVYFAVRTESLNIIQIIFGLAGLKLMSICKMIKYFRRPNIMRQIKLCRSFSYFIHVGYNKIKYYEFNTKAFKDINLFLTSQE